MRPGRFSLNTEGAAQLNYDTQSQNVQDEVLNPHARTTTAVESTKVARESKTYTLETVNAGY